MRSAARRHSCRPPRHVEERHGYAGARQAPTEGFTRSKTWPKVCAQAGAGSKSSAQVVTIASTRVRT
jgi:hypothetical protein